MDSLHDCNLPPILEANVNAISPPSNEAAKQIAERLTFDRQASEAQLTSSSGVIVYQWDSSANTLFGTFVLGMYEGALATLVPRTKIDGLLVE